MRRKISALVAALGLMLGLAAFTGADPASASTCILPSFTNPATGHVYNRQTWTWHPLSNVNRTGCINVGVSGTSTGYRFVVAAQDTVDVSTTGGGVDDYGGMTIVQWHYCDNSTAWTNVVYDWDSANYQYNESFGPNSPVWTSALLNNAANGFAWDFCFRFVGTTRTQSALYTWTTHWNYPGGTTGFAVNY